MDFDLDSRTLASMLTVGMWQPHEVAFIERSIRDRLAIVAAGCANPTAEMWTRELRWYVDPKLRMRWDFYHGWVIERYVEEWMCFAICGVLGHQHVRSDLVDYLKANDLQRIGAAKRLEDKRNEAARQVARNDVRGTERVAAAVDSLSEKRIKEFISVERAIHTGETIVARGQTAKMLDHMYQASYRAEQQAEASPMTPDAFNHPLIHRHKSEVAHGE